MSRALILAAGEGSRLRPLTNEKPKCLVNFLGKSLLERQIATIKNAGIKNINVATGYKADQINDLGLETSFNDRYASTNMVESLFSAVEFIRQAGDLIISYGDIVYQTNNLKKLLTCDDEIALMVDASWKNLWSVRMADPLADAETLIMDDEKYVKELGKKPDSYDQIEGQYTGLIKIRGNKLRDLEDFYNNIDRNLLFDGKNFENMYMTSFLQLLIDASWKVKAVIVNNGWLEIDTIEDLKQYEKMAHLGQLDQFYKLDY